MVNAILPAAWNKFDTPALAHMIHSFINECDSTGPTCTSRWQQPPVQRAQSLCTSPPELERPKSTFSAPDMNRSCQITSFLAGHKSQPLRSLLPLILPGIIHTHWGTQLCSDSELGDGSVAWNPLWLVSGVRWRTLGCLHMTQKMPWCYARYRRHLWGKRLGRWWGLRLHNPQYCL